MSIEGTLAEREARYGGFCTQAGVSQNLKYSMQSSRNWNNLHPFQREALEMIQHKIARMLNGDPNYEDSVVDIIGYATLMLEAMREK